MIHYLKLISILILSGAAIQYIITKIDEKNYPPIGQMVDIGGYRIHINIMGKEHSGPTVVLDMGLGGSMLYWSLVQSEIAKFARVVSYDRPGIGWSDKSPHPRTGQNIAEELHTLLHKANIPGPYILVGHSFAGITSRIYANKYKDEVVGMVIVDSSHERQMEKLPKSTDFLAKILYEPKTHPFILALSKIGGVRLYNLWNYKEGIFDSKTHKTMFAKESNSKFISTILEEWRLFESNLSDARNNKYNIGDIPLFVVTAAMTPSKESCAKHGHATMEVCNLAYEIWHSLQKDLLTKSTNSKQFMAYNSGHVIQQDEPHIIVEAVKEMVSLCQSRDLQD